MTMHGDIKGVQKNKNGYIIKVFFPFKGTKEELKESIKESNIALWY